MYLEGLNQPSDEDPAGSSAGGDDARMRASRIQYLASEAIHRAFMRRWTSEDLPPLADWVRDNEAPLDLFVEASTRPRLYSPRPEWLTGEEDFLSPTLAIGGMFREVGQALSARAMWHVGEGRHSEAWRDLLALHRLSYLLTEEDDSLQSLLLAFAVSGFANEGTRVLLADEHLKETQAEEILGDLQALPKWNSLVDAIDKDGRVWGLRFFLLTFKGDIDLNDPNVMAGGMPIELKLLMQTNVDRNSVLRELNSWSDTLVHALRLPARAARNAALAEISASAEGLYLVGHPDGWRRPGFRTMVASLLSRKQRSTWISRYYLGFVGLGNLHNTEDRANAELNLLRVGAALALHRTRQGQYPEQLSDLVPGVIKQVPLDLFSPTGQPFIYKPDGDGQGFVLYSVFTDGLDDGGTSDDGRIVDGQWASEPIGGELRKRDLVVRFPMPAFELPRLEPEGATDQ